MNLKPLMRLVRYLPRNRTTRLLCAVVVVIAGAVGGLSTTNVLADGPYALKGRVVNVADGDTLTLLVGRDRHRVRLASIDAPEATHGSDRPGQPFSQAARNALADQVAGKTFTLHCYEQDQYKRDICDVPLQGDDTVNRHMVAAGMAWANEQGRGKYMRDPVLRTLEKRARAEKLGLWQQSGAVPPWEWRWRCWDEKGAENRSRGRC